MSKVSFIASLLCWSILQPVFSQSNATATLEIKFKGIRNTKGIISIGINSTPEGWPRQPQMDPNWKKTGMVNGVLTVRVKDLPYGTYAVSVLDDENSNLEIDMFMGIPKEGWGFSKNPPLKLSAPKFEECTFDLDQPHKQIIIELKYVNKSK